MTEERSLGPMRSTIADRLQESYQEAVHVTTSRAVDAEPLVQTADRREDSVTITDVLLGCLSDTLDTHPSFNATFEDGTHTLYEEHNIGVAVDIDAGLVTPVLGDLGSKSVETIAADRRQSTESVMAGDHQMSDLQNGTFTLSNLGVLGVDSFTPIINPPQVAILGLGRLRDEPRPVDEGVEFRQRMTLDLSFDHRVVDGADAARFLGTLADNIGNSSRDY